MQCAKVSNSLLGPEFHTIFKNVQKETAPQTAERKGRFPAVRAAGHQGFYRVARSSSTTLCSGRSCSPRMVCIRSKAGRPVQ